MRRLRRRTMGTKKQSEGEMAMIAGGGRVGKRSSRSRSSSDLQGLEKSACLFAYGCKGPVLYCVNLDGKSHKRRKLCRRCYRDILGEDKEVKPELDEKKLSFSAGFGFGLRDLTPSKSKWVPYGSMVVALGSVVYVLGGLFPKGNGEDESEEDESGEEDESEEDESEDDVSGLKQYMFSHEIFYFDTNHPKSGWIRGPDMLNGRNYGKAIVVEGKIYVFGGNDLEYARDPWAEVLDPINNVWSPLPRPPEDLWRSPRKSVKAVAYGGPSEEKKILIQSHYVYHVNSNTWEEFPYQCLLKWSNNLVGVGNLLYWTYGYKLHVFNMKTGRHYSGEIEGNRIGTVKRYYYDTDPEPTLLHLGGKEFCLLTVDKLEGRRIDRSKIRCSKFKVSKLIRGPDKNHGTLMASMVCRDSYIVNQPLNFDYNHGLVLDGMPGEIKKVEKDLSLKKCRRE